MGLISIADQQRALTGSLMLWVALNDNHPLRTILQSHIRKFSWKCWHTRDLLWLVSPCGHLQGEGFDTWQHICRTWEGLRKHLRGCSPVNVDEWRALPLWRPHQNHHSYIPILRLCRAQQTLRNAGLLHMGDIMNLWGQFLAWDSMANQGLPLSCRNAFQALIASLKPAPDLNPSLDVCELFMEDTEQQLV